MMHMKNKMHIFNKSDLKRLFVPDKFSNKNDNGKLTIIGGSHLFHGAPLLALTTASRFVDMVYFASLDPSVGKAAENLKSQLFSFIWIPFTEVEEYLAKSDCALIGSGLMRFHSEKAHPGETNNSKDKAFKKTNQLTQHLLQKLPNHKWIIDAGSLQTLDPSWIPANSILTPNLKEYKLLFGTNKGSDMAQQYQCHIVCKAPTTIIYSPRQTTKIIGGNAGLTKGGTGDVLAGLTTALYAKNEAHLAASAASFILKSAADDLYKKVGVNYSSDDLARQIPLTFNNLLNSAS